MNKNKSSYFYAGILWGCITFISIIALIVLIYPYYKNNYTYSNELKNKGSENNPFISQLYYKSLLNKKKVIFLYGTSESGSLSTKHPAQNFNQILNSKYQGKPFFYQNSGAGNTPLMWLSNLCTMPKNSIVYYVVNPIYFTSGLNNIESLREYGHRYLSKESYEKTLRCLIETDTTSYDLINLFKEGELKEVSLLHIPMFFINESLDNIFKDKKEESFKQLSPLNKKELSYDVDYIDKYNISNWTVERLNNNNANKVQLINDLTNSVRYKELKALKTTADFNGINMRFILMPTNNQFFKLFNAPYPIQFNREKKQLIDLLCTNNNCIDLTDEKHSKGLFIDSMHFSGYGAKIIALEIIQDLTNNNLIP